MFGAAASPARSRGLGLAETDVFPSNTQFLVRFEGRSDDGSVRRPSHLTWAQIMAHDVRVVREVPATTVVARHYVVEVTDKWRILIPATTRHLYDAVRPLYVANGYAPRDFQVSVMYGARPIPVSPTPSASGGGLDARELSGGVVSDLRQNGSAYDRDRMRAFQRAAGIAVDGLYGEQTRNALLRYQADVPTVASIRSQRPGSTISPGALPSAAGQVGEEPRVTSGAGSWIAAAAVLAIVGGLAWAITK